MTEIIELIMPIYKDQITELDVEASSGELVRCKDCRKNMMCEMTIGKPKDWFCADAKKGGEVG